MFQQKQRFSIMSLNRQGNSINMSPVTTSLLTSLPLNIYTLYLSERCEGTERHQHRGSNSSACEEKPHFLLELDEPSHVTLIFGLFGRAGTLKKTRTERRLSGRGRFVPLLSY
uniref:PPUP7975 n=1 Tax=Poeciliopsis prolifica TaxID=188132 RepID=A0A0S7EX44_9TELE